MRHGVGVQGGPSAGIPRPFQYFLTRKGGVAVALKFGKQGVSEVRNFDAGADDDSAQAHGGSIYINDPEAAALLAVGGEKAALEVGEGTVAGFGSARANVC